MPSPRRPGRPAIVEGETSERQHFRIGATLNDRTCRMAIRSRRSVSAVIRAALERYLTEEERHYLTEDERRVLSQENRSHDHSASS